MFPRFPGGTCSHPCSPKPGIRGLYPSGGSPPPSRAGLSLTETPKARPGGELPAVPKPSSTGTGPALVTSHHSHGLPQPQRGHAPLSLDSGVPQTRRCGVTPDLQHPPQCPWGSQCPPTLTAAGPAGTALSPPDPGSSQPISSQEGPFPWGRSRFPACCHRDLHTPRLGKRIPALPKRVPPSPLPPLPSFTVTPPLEGRQGWRWWHRFPAVPRSPQTPCPPRCPQRGATPLA